VGYIVVVNKCLIETGVLPKKHLVLDVSAIYKPTHIKGNATCHCLTTYGTCKLHHSCNTILKTHYAHYRHVQHMGIMAAGRLVAVIKI